MDQLMYHTQNKSEVKLKAPAFCKRKDAWFGPGYYFWEDYYYAEQWGIQSKRNNYDIYSAQIKSDNVLDIVFNREHYDFFKAALEKIRNRFSSLTDKRILERYIYEYFRDTISNRVDVLLADDYSLRDERNIGGRPYVKRIQAAVYNLDCVHDFKLIE